MTEMPLKASSFSFSHIVFKRLELQTHENKDRAKRTGKRLASDKLNEIRMKTFSFLSAENIVVKVESAVKQFSKDLFLHNGNSPIWLGTGFNDKNNNDNENTHRNMQQAHFQNAFDLNGYRQYARLDAKKHEFSQMTKTEIVLY